VVHHLQVDPPPDKNAASAAPAPSPTLLIDFLKQTEVHIEFGAGVVGARAAFILIMRLFVAPVPQHCLADWNSGLSMLETRWRSEYVEKTVLKYSIHYKCAHFVVYYKKPVQNSMEVSQ
jgi:hypothetical protein